jgi:hypothetical protein
MQMSQGGNRPDGTAAESTDLAKLPLQSNRIKSFDDCTFCKSTNHINFSKYATL